MEQLISVEKPQEKLKNHENVLILDIRPTDQRNEWMLANSLHVDAYQKLREGDDTAPDDTENFWQK